MKPYLSYKPSGVPWLGEVPSHWEINTIKRGYEITLGKMLQSEQKASTEVVAPYLRSANVQSEKVDVSDVQTMWFSAHEVHQLALKPNDLVVCEGGDAGRSAIWHGEIDGCYFQNSVNRVRGAYNNTTLYLMRWLGVVKSCGYMDIVCNKATIAHLTKEKLANLPMLFPPPNEQHAIAEYLDVETARIDTLIHEKNELIGLLREWRQSVIAEYTSGATRPQGKQATGNVHMPWIPSDWSMVRLGKYARIGNGSTPLKDNANYWEGGTFPWLNSAVVNRDTVDEGSEYVTDAALRACHLPIVEPGALLVALTGQGKTRGQVTVLCIQATINQHLAYLALDESRFDTDYLFWTLTGMYAALRMVSDGQGGTKGALTCDDLARFEVPMPSLSVQRKIAKAITSETDKIDDLIVHTHDEISLLKELRAATIADAVLGRIDVRTARTIPLACRDTP